MSLEDFQDAVVIVFGQIVMWELAGLIAAGVLLAALVMIDSIARRLWIRLRQKGGE